MKQLFIAVGFLAAAAAAAAAQAPQAKTLPAVAPTTTPSPVNTGPPVSAVQETPDAVQGPADAAGRGEHPPESADPGVGRTNGSILPVPGPTPAGDVPSLPTGDAARPPPTSPDVTDQSRNGPDKASVAGSHFRWRAAVEQTLLFLSIQHGYALTQPKTRRDLRGSFFKDYARSVRSLHGWGDGGKFFTNYVAHPMQGSLLGFVQVQNDPVGSRLKLGRSGDYWRSRMKALAWSAAWSTQFELGPLSQASLGNVGLHGKQTYVDLVMTPTAGIGLLVAEDALDRYVIERLERRSGSAFVRIVCRMALNPTRTTANLLRFKKPWHRDSGLR